MLKAIRVSKENYDLVTEMVYRRPSNKLVPPPYLSVGNYMVISEDPNDEDQFFSPDVFKKRFKFLGKANSTKFCPIRERKIETLRAIKVTPENVGMVLAEIMVHRENVVVPEEKDILGYWLLLGDGYERVYRKERVFLAAYSMVSGQVVSNDWIEVERAG